MTDWSEHEFDTVVDKAKAVRSMVNIIEVAELLGLEPDHNGKIHSPYNDQDHTPSCQLYMPDHFHCYSTGRGGDAIDLVQAVTGRTWGQAVHVLWTRGLRAGFEPGRHQAVAKPEPVDLYGTFHPVWSASNLAAIDDWAGKLDVEPALVQQLVETEEVAILPDEMWVAHWHKDADGRPAVRGIKTRGLSGGKGSITGSQYTHGLYRWMDPQHDVAVITEGESDCWVLSWLWRYEPVDVFALPSGAGLWRDEWLAELAGHGQVWTAFDNDQAGRTATDKVARAVGYARAERLTVPSLYNDVRAAYAAGWRPNPPR